MNDTITQVSIPSLKPVSADQVRNVMQYVREHNINGSVVGRYVDHQFKIFSFDELREDMEQNPGGYIVATQGQFLAHCLLLKALPPDIGRRETSARDHEIRTLYRAVNQLPRNARTLAPEAKKQLITMLGNQEAELIKELGEMMNAPYQSTSQIKSLIQSMRNNTSEDTKKQARVAKWRALASDRRQPQNGQTAEPPSEEQYAEIREGVRQLARTLNWASGYFTSNMKQHGFEDVAQFFLKNPQWRPRSPTQFFDALAQLLVNEQDSLAAISLPTDMRRTRERISSLPVNLNDKNSITMGQLCAAVEDALERTANKSGNDRTQVAGAVPICR